MNWDQVWRDHWKEIYRYVYDRVHDRQEAEDIAQEAFLKLIRSEMQNSCPSGSVIALLKTTARNLLIDAWRRRGGYRNVPLEAKLTAACGAPGPEIVTEQKDEVKRALSLLGEEQRKLVKYRLLYGYSVRETAELMGKSESAVKTMQCRAIESVRTIMLMEVGA